MKYRIFSENEWVYPDSPITPEGGTAVLYAARGTDVSFQVLTDLTLTGGEVFSLSAKDLGCTAVVYQLLPAYVSENSGPKVFTTTDYEEVKHFVTRRAPFTLYEITKPLDSGILEGGRLAF